MKKKGKATGLCTKHTPPARIHPRVGCIRCLAAAARKRVVVPWSVLRAKQKERRKQESDEVFSLIFEGSPVRPREE